MPTASARRWRAAWWRCATPPRRHLSTSPLRAKPNGNFWLNTASCSAPTSSFTGTIDGYAIFDDFLATLNSRHRKAIKRERREALANGITIHPLTGNDITEDAWDAFFDFYMETGSRKWGRPYLTRQFFSLIGESMAKDVLLVMAKRNGRWIAGAINFIGSDTLFGRNWGAIEHHRSCISRSATIRPSTLRLRAA